MKIFDTHTHDYFESFDENREKMLTLCREAGVEGKVQIGCDKASSLQALKLAKKNKNMWSTLGIHPCDAEKNAENFLEIFADFQKIFDENLEKIVGVGETGFDFFHKDTPEMRTLQEKIFLEHLQFAQKNSLPLIIHSRDSASEIIDFLRKHKNLLERASGKFSGVLHCFSEDTAVAKIFTEELNFCLGIGGTSTYKKNIKIREAIVNTDMKFLVTETDSPFLAPQKHRGKQNNSSYITEIITLISELKNIPEKKCAEILFQNAEQLFGLKNKTITPFGKKILEGFQENADKKVLVADNDSTVMTGEIIDTIAEILGESAQKKIEEITNIQMNGESAWTFRESLEMRVKILMSENFSEKHIAQCIEKMKFSEGFEHCVQKILDMKKTLKNNIFILSGGFEEVIIGKIQHLDIPESEKQIFSEQVFANRFLFDKNQKISGVNFESFKNKMWTETAKRDKILWLESEGMISPDQKILAVGDGSNDLGILPSQERGLFVAFTGTVARKNTIEKSNGVCADNFYEIEKLLF